MKKNKLITISTLCIVLIASLLYSCRKETGQSSSESNITKPIGILSHIGINNKSYDVYSLNSKSKSNPGRRTIDYNEDIYSIENAGFYDLIDTLRSNFTGAFCLIDSSSIMSVVLYSSSPNDDIQLNTVSALSVFMLNSLNKLEHRFFVVNTMVTYELTGLRITTKKYSTYDFVNLRNNYVNSTSTKSYLMLKSQNFLNLSSSSYGSDYLSKVIIDNNIPIENAVINGGGGSGCSCSGCNIADDGGCVYDEFGTAICDACECDEVGDFNTQMSYGLNIDSILPKPPAYDFRDNFLKNTSIGVDYVNYYYIISYLSRGLNVMNTGNFYTILDFGVESYIVADKLKNGEDSCVIITTSYKNKALAMIDIYRNATNNTQINLIFDNIEDDLIHFEGMTKIDVLNEID